MRFVTLWGIASPPAAMVSMSGKSKSGKRESREGGMKQKVTCRSVISRRSSEMSYFSLSVAIANVAQ